MPAGKRHIPITTVHRLSQYYRVLARQGMKGCISSGELAAATGLNSAIVRRDLSYFGKFGVPGRGYSVPELKARIFDILGIGRQWRIALIGLGNLGSALIRYKGFERKGYKIVSVFDIDPAKIGRARRGIEVKNISDLKSEVSNRGINMAIVTVPAGSGKEVLDRVVGAGIKAVLNFAPVKVSTPDNVCVVNIDIGIEIEKLTFLALQEKNSK